MPEVPNRLKSRTAENHSTSDIASTMIDVMFRHAFLLAASAVADAPKAAVLVILAAVDGARS
ncbi:hypothetical protein [Streptomyces cupreus]|uniref:Uncharacterized protein n=1 Tax=Streptomyces cupreus TaxID=2759956 RepID=A0A7X1M901_9ACTN|nr:hypothetical protein [Streptomyces cupreus]MBC2902724.1 hypothetical protein [Streptomyces cupreus]